MKRLVVQATMRRMLIGILLFASVFGNTVPSIYAMPNPGPPCGHPIDHLPECEQEPRVPQRVQQTIPLATTCCQNQMKEFFVNTFRSHIVRATAAAAIVLAGFAAELSIPALRSLGEQYNVTASLVGDVEANFGTTTVQAADNQQRAYARPRNANARATIRPL